MKTSKYLIAIGAIASMFAGANSAIAADKDEGTHLDVRWMSPINASAQTEMVAKIKANIAAKKGPCSAIDDDIKAAPEEFVLGRSSTLRCDKAPYGALLYGTNIQNVDGKPVRSGFVFYVTAEKTVDVLAASGR